MLVILRPGIIDISLGVYMALASSFMWSVVIIITKVLKMIAQSQFYLMGIRI